MDQKFIDKMEKIHANLVSHDIVAIDYSYIEPLIISNQKYETYHVRQAVRFLEGQGIRVLNTPRTQPEWDQISEKIYQFRELPKEKRRIKTNTDKKRLKELFDMHKKVDERKEFISEDDALGNLDTLALFVSDISSGNFHTEVLSKNEEVELFRRYRAGDQEAKRLLWEANVRLAYKYVKTTYGNTVDKDTFNDLVQEACMVLSKAIDKFDLSRGTRFSTYAHYWIRQAVRRNHGKIKRIVALPLQQSQQIGIILGVQEKLTQENGYVPSNQEIATYINDNDLIMLDQKKVIFTEKEIGEYLSLGYMTNPLSFSMPVGEEQEDTFGDFIADEKTNLEKDVQLGELSEILDKALKDNLTLREEYVIRQTFGMNEEGEERTLKVLGEELHITTERVRQIRKKALSKLRLALYKLQEGEDAI